VGAKTDASGRNSLVYEITASTFARLFAQGGHH
jgi:hypothetical protein